MSIPSFLKQHDAYSCRRTVRPTKVDKIQADYDAVYGAGRVEIVGMSDLAKGDFTSILQGMRWLSVVCQHIIITFVCRDHVCFTSGMPTP